MLMLLSSDDGFGSTVIHGDYPSAGISPYPPSQNPPAGRCCPCTIDPLFYSPDSPLPHPANNDLPLSQAVIRVIFRLIIYYSEEKHSLFNRTEKSVPCNDRISLSLSFSLLFSHFFKCLVLCSEHVKIKLCFIFSQSLLLFILITRCEIEECVLTGSSQNSKNFILRMFEFCTKFMDRSV